MTPLRAHVTSWIVAAFLLAALPAQTMSIVQYDKMATRIKHGMLIFLLRGHNKSYFRLVRHSATVSK
jgi:hypothetical protein